MTIGIYSYTDKATGEVVYVGQSRDIETRRKAHESGNVRRGLMAKAMAKIGADAFEFRIEQVCTIDELNAAEAAHIARLGTFPHRFNRTSGGGSKVVYCDATKAAISASLMGHGHSQETRDKIAASLRGRAYVNTPGRKAAVAARKGVARPDEVRERIASTMTGQKHPPARVEANRAGQVGKALSDAHRAKISAGLRACERYRKAT